ncbi:translation initiation factor IF-1 [Holospora obtusa F1]|uniref:Translation initiation factor IF-1 n=1 Tax=Holospora obtusa F1 TaxID=1399147 RepID=W6TD92_HOLOB|nr:translation initiation factor IF-1 [Holospora obtusa]ETZ06691.1 translation initiation factor IF-1 [Holospora obtusa F1]
MTKTGILKFTGIVLECLPNARFSIQLDGSDQIVNAYIAGKMRTNRIMVSVGDKVLVEFSPHDLSQGRIRYRER